MFTVLLIIHVLICALLITVVLMQSGRGGGLTESFSGMESLFGAKTNALMVRATAVLAVLFIVSCLSLAYLSTKRSRSLLEGEVAPEGQIVEMPAPEQPAVEQPVAEPQAVPAEENQSQDETSGQTQAPAENQ